MSTPITWPLAIMPFTLRDKLAISWWLLSQDRYTMGERVTELEGKLSKLSGMHTLCLSSGSAANQLVFELWKMKHMGKADAIVIAPAVSRSFTAWLPPPPGPSPAAPGRVVSCSALPSFRLA